MKVIYCRKYIHATVICKKYMLDVGLSFNSKNKSEEMCEISVYS